MRAHDADRCHTPQCREGGGRRDVLRPATGVRPGVLKDPGQPWVEAVTVGYVAASVPPLGVPLLQGDEGVHAAALELLEEAEEKDIAAEYMELVRSGFSKSERMREVVRRRHVLRQKGRGRKKKKRKRRKLPESSSLQSSRGARIRRCGQGSRSRSSLSGAQCSLWSSTGLRCSASWPVCTRGTVMQWAGLAGCSSRGVPCGCRLAQTPGIMAVMDQKDTYAVGFLSTAPCIWQSLVLFGSCLSSTVRVYSGRRLPELPYSALLGSTVDTYLCQSTGIWEYCLRIQRNAWSSVVHAVRQLRSSRRRFPCRGAEADFHGLAVQQTIVLLQLQLLDKVIDGPIFSCRSLARCVQRQVLGFAVAVHQPGRRFPCRGLACSEDHRDYAVAVYFQVVDVPVVQVQQILRCCLWETVEFPQCSSSHPCLDKVVVIPVVAQMQMPLVRFP